MQLALLSGASPLLCKECPTVRLQAGTWEFMVDGLKDSILVLHHNIPFTDPILVRNGGRICTSESGDSKLEFTSRGSERYITINVKRVN